MKLTREFVEVVFSRGHIAAASLLAARWLQTHPDDLYISIERGNLLSRMNRHEQAIQEYQNAIGRIEKCTREMWPAFAGLGRIHRDWGRLPEAEPWFHRAIEIAPDEVASQVLLGACQARQGKLKEAEATHRGATRWTESSLLDEAHHNLGLVLRGQGRLAEAAECFRKAIEIDPDYKDAIEALADVEYADTKEVTSEIINEAFRNDQAATMVRLAPRWLELHPEDLFIFFNYAEMLYKMTRYEEALCVYESAAAKFEDRRWGICNSIGHMYQYWGRPEDAEPWFQKAIEIHPNEVGSYLLLGAAQARQDKLKEAEATYRAAIRWPDHWELDEAHHNLGLVLRSQERWSEAAECFQNAIEINSEYTDPVEALADVELTMALTENQEP